MARNSEKAPEDAVLTAALLPSVFEHAGVGIAVLDQEGRFLAVNAAFRDFLGRDLDELLHLAEADLSPAGDPIVSATIFPDLLTGKRSRHSIDKRYLHKNGSVIWGRMTFSALRHDERDLVVAIAEDITEKRGIEELSDQVRRAHERYALVARATNDVIWDWDAEHGTIVWNDAVQAMFGYAPDEIDNRLQWWDSHIHPADRERVVNGINRIIEQGGSSWTDEYRFERADGTFTEVLDRGYIARSEDGTPIRMIGAMLDVTERKHAERIATFMAEASAVLASSLDYHVTLARVAQRIVPLLGDHCIIDLCLADGSLERLAAVGDPGWAEKDTIHAGLVPADTIKAVIADGTPMLLDTPRGSFVCSGLIVPIAVSDHPPMGAFTLAMSHSGRTFGERDLKVVEDVTRRAAMAIEHARLYTDVQKASLAKDEFLAILSHELSTPLTIILGWSGIISQKDATTEQVQRGIEAIRGSALAQARLIDDVLDLSRVTTGKLNLRLEPVAIGSLVEDCLTAVRVAAAAKRIELIVSHRSSAEVLGDPNRLRQVIWNLLNNAIKFTEAGGTVTVGVEEQEEAVRLTIADTGRGIDPDFLGHIFEPFRQADASTTRTHGGLGLGLAIVRYLVEAHGGIVKSFSEGAGRGTTFVVELPSSVPAAVAPASNETAADPETNAPLAGARLSGVHVLFVDDQAEARDLADVILSGAGAKTTLAASAREAIAVFDRGNVDVIVSDVAMPDMDGYALIAEIRSRDALSGTHTPAIAATAYRGAEDRTRVLAEGFDVYLGKPMEADALTSAIARLLERQTER